MSRPPEAHNNPSLIASNLAIQMNCADARDQLSQKVASQQRTKDLMVTESSLS
jgi:hypothetical protein